MNRRVFLKTLGTAGTAGLTGLTGCSAPSDLEEPTIKSQTYRSPSRTPTKTKTESASPTPTPDTERPVIESYDISATPTAGELAIMVDASDNVELNRAVVRTSVDEVHRMLDGRSDSLSVRIRGSPGENERVRLILEDEAGNRTSEMTESYVRKYDVFEDTRLDMSAVYIPFTGDKMKVQDCVNEVQPAVGEYGDPIPPEISSRHIDQMQGHGITTVSFDFGEGREDYFRWETFTDSQLFSEIDVECYYVLSQALKRERPIGNDFEFIRENMLQLENYNTVNGRPIVQFWGATFPAWGGTERSRQVKDEIMDEYGGFEEFMGYIRSELTINGKNPFLIGEFRNTGIGGVPEKYQELFSQFDAASSWTGVLEAGETISQETSYKQTRRNFEGLRSLAEKNDMEFVLTVYPGFDDRHNKCWGEDRHVPRSPEFMSKLLNLADSYRTIDKINISTFNGWGENPIEPGTFRGTNYGTDYLEVVKRFQQGEAGG